LFFSLLKNTKNSSVAMAMQRFFEFFRRKNYGALWNNLFNFFHLRSSAMRVKFSQTYKKNNFFIWGRLFSSSSLMSLPCQNRKRGSSLRRSFASKLNRQTDTYRLLCCGWKQCRSDAHTQVVIDIKTPQMSIHKSVYRH